MAPWTPTPPVSGAGGSQDITGLVRQGEQLAMLQDLHGRAESVVSMGSFRIDLTTELAHLSPGLRALLGRSGEVASGAVHVRDLLHPDDADLGEAAYTELVTTGRLEPTVLRVLRADGDVRLHELRATCRYDADGHPLEALGLSIDVTARERWESERRDLLARIVTAADDERRRIAEHLHDVTIQDLTAALLHVDHVANTSELESLSRVRSMLGDVATSLRSEIVRIDPAGVGSDGLGPMLEMTIADLFSGSAVTITVRVDVEGESTISPRITSACYRIAREALSNAREHAAAENVGVSIRRDGAWLIGEVSDDGVGFDRADGRAPGHLGLRLMAERAQLVGGDVIVVGGPEGRGTTVSWHLPL